MDSSGMEVKIESLDKNGEIAANPEFQYREY
jgi:hypothetical protein